MQQKESKSNWHFKISIAKSLLRMLAGAALATGNLYMAGATLIVAELFGIIEEL
jgi:hypothetical protein